MKLAVVLLILLMSLASMTALLGAGAEEPVVPMETTLFTDVAYDVGLGGVYGNYLAWGDYDNDDNQDLLIGWQIYHNNGPPEYKYTKASSSLGITTGGGFGTWGDFNNDGWLDFYSAGGQDFLYMNNEGKSFTDIADKAGVNNPSIPSTAAGWGDYDRDGYLDLYVAGGENWNDGDPIYYGDVLYRNNGDGTFENVTAKAGVDEFASPKYGRGVDWCDFNNDGWLDIYVPNYRQTMNYLYKNNRDGTFTDVGLDTGTADGAPYDRDGNPDPYNRPGHSCGAAWADLDNDLDFDMWLTNLNHKDARTSDDSLLYRNDGGPDYSFTNVRGDSGIPVKPYVAPNEGDELMVGIAIGDYDSDGLPDLFIPQIYDNVAYAYSLFYHNLGGMTFEEVSNTTGVQVWDTYAGCFCDYDNDGDLDLLTAGKKNSTEGAKHELKLYQNNVDNGNHWLQLELEGRESNRAAIGARVYATFGATTLVRQVEGGMGCHGMQNQLPLFFGLGTYSGDVEVKVMWPSGKVQEMTVPGVDRRLTVVEDDTAPDLAITNVSLSKYSAVSGQTIDITAGLANAGNATSADFVIDIYAQVTGTQWKYDIASVNKTTLAPGQTAIATAKWTIPNGTYLYEVHAKARGSMPAEKALDNNDAYANLTVRSENKAPVPVLTSSAASIGVGQEVTFWGEDSYDDIAVEMYQFDFGDGEGSGWKEDDSAVHSYSAPGNYTATLAVVDNEGLESKQSATLAIKVTDDYIPPPSDDDEEPDAPVAVIESINPNPAKVGTEVAFTGSAASSRMIRTYEWTAEPLGRLSSFSTFYYTFYEAGTYEVTLRVQDSKGLWSEPVSRTLKVRTELIPPTLTITEPMKPSITISENFYVRGTTTDDEKVQLVQFRLDGGAWQDATGEEEFEVFIDISDYKPGSNHTVEVRAFDGDSYSKIETVKFAIAQDEGGGDGGGSSFFWIAGVGAIILVLVIVLVAVVIRWMRSEPS